MYNTTESNKSENVSLTFQYMRTECTVSSVTSGSTSNCYIYVITELCKMHHMLGHIDIIVKTDNVL